MHRRAVWLPIALIAMQGWSQEKKPGPRELPNFDFRTAPVRGRTAAGQPPATLIVERRARSVESFLAAQRQAYPGVRSTPNRYGIPKLLVRDGGALTPPSSAAPAEIAKAFLRSHSAIFQFSLAEIEGLRLLINDAGKDATRLVFNQTAGGIDVFEGQVKFTLSKAGEIVQAGAGEAAPGLVVSPVPTLSPEQAVRAAFRAAGVSPPANLVLDAQANGQQAFLNPRGTGRNPITFELNVFPLNASEGRLAYRVFLDLNPQSYYEELIDANDGTLLYRHNLYVNALQGTVWKKWPVAGASRDAAVQFPPADDPMQAPDPWLPATPTGIAWITQGNNADAYLDEDADGQPDNTATSEITSGRAYSLTGDFAFNYGDGLSGLNPRLFKSAAVTNLFYFVNLAHDYFYSLGFSEAAGNFQSDNYGRGGTGGDPVHAEAQYGGFENNSAFAPTKEGTPPRLLSSLFTRDTSNLTDDLDSAYDGDVVFHEYTHGVSNRLVGGGNSTSCLANIQSGALGEGWSDYFSISFFNDPVEGAYLTQNPGVGIRRQSYEGYSYTYEDIGNQGYEAHNDGEIWAAMLWDLRKALGRTLTDKLVIDGMKSTPCHPSMIDARDAILAADTATNGGANRGAMWRTFARHGMGYSARGIDGDALSGTVYDAAYDQPPDLSQDQAPKITSNPLSTSAALSDVYSYQIAATNPNAGSLTYQLKDGPAGMTVSSTGQVNWTATFISQRVKVVVSDGKGGTVTHGYYLPVVTPVAMGSPITLDAPIGSDGFATFVVPPDTQILQVTLRGGTGDADMLVEDPGGSYGISERDGNTETLSFANPAAGLWKLDIYAYKAYAGLSLTASAIAPIAINGDATLTDLSGQTSSETFYRITIPPGKATFAVATSGGTGDVDIYLSKNVPPTCQGSPLVTEDCVYDQESGNGGNADTVGVVNPAAGDWYLNLSGYGSYTGVTLTTSTAPVAIDPAWRLPTAYLGVYYSQKVYAAVGGAPPYTWSLTSGSLPSGLSLSSSGYIMGPPSVVGSFSFTLQVRDASGATASGQFTLGVTIPPLAISTTSLPDGAVGSPYVWNLSATGGVPPYSWTVAGGTLPSGVTLTSVGTFSGTVTAIGSFAFTLQVTDAAETSVSKAFTIRTGPAGSLGGIITTIAGSSDYGAFSGDNGPATAARLNEPSALARDTAGNIYIADAYNSRVRRIAPDGVITTVAGTGTPGFSGDGGPAVNASLGLPVGLAIDLAGNLYISDWDNAHIRKVTPAGTISTVAGNGSWTYAGDGAPATAASFDANGIAVDRAGNLYIADAENNRVRKVTSDGVIHTVAGTGVAGFSGDGGPAAQARLDYPFYVAVDAVGNLWISDSGNSRIRKVTVDGIITTIAGTGEDGYSGDGGAATSATLGFPAGVVADNSGDLYVADYNNSRVRKIGPDGIITTVAGNGGYGSLGDGGSALAAQVGGPFGVDLDASGNLYIADIDFNRVRKVAGAGAAALSIVTPPVLPTAFTGTPYSQTLAAVNGTAPYVWTLLSGTMPAGLSLSADGVISGRAPDAGSFTFTIRVQDAASMTAARTFTLAVVSPLTITTASPLLTAWTGGTFFQTLNASGGTPPYSWSLASGSLPAGLTLSASGSISGTATAAGSANFTVQVADWASEIATKQYSMAVVQPAGSMSRVGALSQLAYGGGWDTAIWLTNSGSSRISVQLRFRKDDGGEMNLPYTATQEGHSETNSGSTLNRVINPNTTLVVQSAQGVAVNTQGFAEVSADGAIGGFAVFRYAPGGLEPGRGGFVTPWEGTVPLQTQMNATGMVLPFDNTGGFATGFAVGNLTSATASIAAILYGDDGAQLGSPQTVSLGANSHIANMVGTQWPFAAGKRGVVKFSGPAMAGLGLRAGPYGTVTSLPAALPGGLSGRGALSQIASGGGWDTAIWLTNSSPAAIPVQVKFHGDSGADMILSYTATQQGAVQTGSGASLSRTINPNTTLVVETGKGIATNSQGWAEVIANGEISGFAVFRYAPAGLDPSAGGFVTPWEATVPLQTQMNAATLFLPFDNTSGFSIGFAIGNPGATLETVTAVAYDENGNLLGSPETIELGPYSHMADMMGTRWTFTAGKRGIVKFTAPAVIGLGIRASPYGTVTSVPALFN